jgi:hypothetical protein
LRSFRCCRRAQGLQQFACAAQCHHSSGITVSPGEGSGSTQNVPAGTFFDRCLKTEKQPQAIIDTSHGVRRKLPNPFRRQRLVYGQYLGDVHDGSFGKTQFGQRYCINSASLRFTHPDKMEAEAYGVYLSQVGVKS